MASLKLQTAAQDRFDDYEKGDLFKHRHYSRHGYRCAQVEFDRRVAAGQFARLVRWNKGIPKVVAETPTGRIAK